MEGVNVAETPEGRPLALSATPWANPFIGWISKLAAPVCPWDTSKLFGSTTTRKSRAVVTFSVSVFDALKLPLVHVTLGWYVPGCGVVSVLIITANGPG